MTTTTVHVAVFDTLADWEIGYATAHIRSDQWQRAPGRYSITTVGPTREPVITMGGLRVTPDIALEELRPEDSAMLILAGRTSPRPGSSFTETAIRLDSSS